MDKNNKNTRINYMACIYGASASGKTTSVYSLPVRDTVIIKMGKTELPFFGKNFNSVICNSYNKIPSIIKKCIEVNKKYVVLDDYHYPMIYQFLDEARLKSYDKFNVYAQEFSNFLRTDKYLDIKSKITIFINLHDYNDNGNIKIKTIGKLLEEKLTVEGLFDYLIYCSVEYDNDSNKASYKFITNCNNDLNVKAKSNGNLPTVLPNDLFILDKLIQKGNNEQSNHLIDYSKASDEDLNKLIKNYYKDN